MRAIPAACTAAAVAAAGLAGAADVPEELRRCAAIEDDGRRLACYDRWVAGESGTQAEPGATRDARDDAPPPARAESRAQAEARFGLPEREPEEEKLEEITATVTRIVTRANGERIFTLDNGQVWVEDAPTRSVRVKEGDTVRIRAGLFGSFRLSVGTSPRSTGVDRVR